jgi:xanthine dehydrogenase accessory factor
MSIAQGVIPRTAPPEEVLREALAAHARGVRCAIATVVSRQGSAPSTPGQKLCLWGGGERVVAVGTVGGGAVERAVMLSMLDALSARSAPRVHTFRLGPELGMCCGGSAEILIEVLEPARAIVLVGAGHVGAATARLLPGLGFRVLLVDARAEATEADRAREIEALGVRVLGADHDDPEVLESLVAPPADAAMIAMTHDHRLDQTVIEWALATGFAFVGGVGSRAKAVRTRQRLEAKGFAAADIARVKMPVGIGIGARTPEEIAVSIAGELVAWRNRHTASEPAAKTQPAPRAVPTKETPS